MKIGDKSVIYRETILVPDTTEASFDVSIGSSGPITFVVRFNPDAEKAQVRWKGEGKTIRIDFDKWANPLGTVINEPQKLGTFGGVGDVYLYIFHHRVGTVNRLDFQLLSEGKA
jgi:hypothetical protein